MLKKSANAEQFKVQAKDIPCDSSVMIDSGTLSVNSGRIRYVLEETIG